jgi:hypothetical protein
MEQVDLSSWDEFADRVKKLRRRATPLFSPLIPSGNESPLALQPHSSGSKAHEREGYYTIIRGETDD